LQGILDWLLGQLSMPLLRERRVTKHGVKGTEAMTTDPKLLPFVICAFLLLPVSAHAENVQAVPDDQLNALYKTCLDHLTMSNTSLSPESMTYQNGWSNCRLVGMEYWHRQSAKFEAAQKQQELRDLAKRTVIEGLTP
jgi:hypothetical protein